MPSKELKEIERAMTYFEGAPFTPEQAQTALACMELVKQILSTKGTMTTYPMLKQRYKQLRSNL